MRSNVPHAHSRVCPTEARGGDSQAAVAVGPLEALRAPAHRAEHVPLTHT